MAVIGDGQGKVSWGYGKANEVPPAVEKAVKDGSRNMIPIHMEGTSIPHMVQGQFGASTLVLIPAGPGTGVIAGTSVRGFARPAGSATSLRKVKDPLILSIWSKPPSTH